MVQPRRRRRRPLQATRPGRPRGVGSPYCGKCMFLCCRAEEPDVCLLQCSVSVHEATISDSEASEALALTEFTTFPTASTIPLPGHHLQPAPELNAPTADPLVLPIPPAGPPPSSQVQLIMGSFLYSGGTTYHDNLALTLYSGGTASVEQPAASFDNGSASSGGATP